MLPTLFCSALCAGLSGPTLTVGLAEWRRCIREIKKKHKSYGNICSCAAKVRTHASTRSQHARETRMKMIQETETLAASGSDPLATNSVPGETVAILPEQINPIELT